MQPDQLLHERQADAAAFDAAAPGALDTMKPLEQMRQFAGRDAGAGVAHRDVDRLAVGGRTHVDRDLALEGELQGIREKVEDNLLPHVAIDMDGGRQRLAIDAEAKAGAVDGRAERRGQLGGEGTEIHCRKARLRLAGLDAGKIEQGVDELQQPHAVAVGDADQLAVVGTHFVAGLGQDLLQRAQHQGERGAEFMADVGEERRLRPVDLGQGLGPPALSFIGFGIGDGRCDLSGDEIEKARIVVVEQAEGVEAGDDEARPARLAAGRDRQDDRVARRHVPGTAGHPAVESGGEIADDLRRVALQRGSNGPRVRRIERQGRNRGGMVPGDARRAHERSRAAARLGHVDHGEWQIARIGCQRPGGAVAGLLPGPGLRRRRRQFAQERELALADHPLGVVAVGAEDAAGRAVFGRDRAVGEGVVGLFGVAVALHDQELGFDIGALVAAHRRGEHGPDVAPDLAPDLGRRTAQRPGMLAADDRFVGVVVEIDQVPPPADPDRLARGEHDADGCLEALRP